MKSDCLSAFVPTCSSTLRPHWMRQMVQLWLNHVLAEHGAQQDLGPWQAAWRSRALDQHDPDLRGGLQWQRGGPDTIRKLSSRDEVVLQ